jgi:succinate dehydrogenase / fumarate reductase, membrane anchor subunit
MQISPTSRGRARPSGGRGDVASWYLMRLSGVALFVLALGHFSILHFIYDPAQQTAEFIQTHRWNELFWRGYDWLLLMLVLFHSFVGIRTIVLDYVHPPRARLIVVSSLYLLAAVLFVAGTLVVATMPGAGAAVP